MYKLDPRCITSRGFSNDKVQWNPGLTISGITIFPVGRSTFACPAKVIGKCMGQKLASVAWRSSHSGRRKRRAAKKVAAEGMGRGKRGKEHRPPTAHLTGEMFERNYSQFV